MLRTMREALVELKNSDQGRLAKRKKVVKLASKHLRTKTTHVCNTPLILTLGIAYYDAVECVDGERRQFTPIVSDEYVVLRTNTDPGCDLSILGLSTDANIVMTSNTVDSQQKKGYNTLLRAVGVMIAYVEHKKMHSEVSNAWSAYTLIKEYQTSVVFKDGTRKNYHKPLEKKTALEIKKDCRHVYLRPTQDNMIIATRLFARADVKCF